MKGYDGDLYLALLTLRGALEARDSLITRQGAGTLGEVLSKTGILNTRLVSRKNLTNRGGSTVNLSHHPSVCPRKNR